PVTSSVKLLNSQPMSCWAARVGAEPLWDPDGAVILGMSPPVTFSLLYTSTPATALTPTLDSPVVGREQTAHLLRGAALVGRVCGGRGGVHTAGYQLCLWHALGEPGAGGPGGSGLGRRRGGAPAAVRGGTPFRGHRGPAVAMGVGDWSLWPHRRRAAAPRGGRGPGLRHRVSAGPWCLHVSTQVQRSMAAEPHRFHLLEDRQLDSGLGHRGRGGRRRGGRRGPGAGMVGAELVQTAAGDRQLDVGGVRV